MEDLKPSDAVIRVMSGADLQYCGTVCVSATCNEITKKAKVYVTKHDYALILGLEFCKMFNLVKHATLYAHFKVYLWNPTK